MRTGAIVKRICLQMLRDKRTLALLFVAPLLILTLMYYLFNGTEVEPQLGVTQSTDEAVVQMLDKAGLNIRKYETADKETIIDDELDGLLVKSSSGYELILHNTDPAKGRAVLMKVNQAVMAAAVSLKIPNAERSPNTLLDTSMPVSYIYGDEETSFFDILSCILIGFFVFFFVFLISGIGLLRERTTGTLERLVSTPVRRWEIISGYLAGYGIFALIQTLIIVTYAIHVLDISLAGSIWNVILINVILALTALSLGILLSSFASSEFQMVQFIPIVIIPQIFFAGIIPLEGMADWLQAAGRVMPLYYAADALTGVMYKGWGLSQISNDLMILALFAAIFVTLNIFALKKYRKL